MSNKLGELNGRWLWFMKLCLVCIPVISVAMMTACGWVIVFCIGISAEVSDTLSNFDKRITVIESNRFTSEDGMGLWKQLSRLQMDFDHYKNNGGR